MTLVYNSMRFIRPDGSLRLSCRDLQSSRTQKLRHRCNRLDMEYHFPEREFQRLSLMAEPDLLRVTPLAAGQTQVYSWASPGKHLEIFHARVAVLSLAHHEEAEVSIGTKLGTSDAFEDIAPVTLPERTHRVVLHQNVAARKGHYLCLHGRGLRELVLVFVPKPGPQAIKSYLEELLPAIPDVAVTVVGLDVELIHSLGQTLTERIDLRTLEEHREAVGEARWAQEMEL
jgi:hypothetical protein